MTKSKLLGILIIIFLPFILFSQKKVNSKVFFDTEIKKVKVKFHEEDNFNKAQFFFGEKNWDSTLVYSMKQIELGKIPELKDYCHYFRGFSFKEKKLFKEAEKEFNKVSNKFKFYYKIYINLGEIALEQNKIKLALDYFLCIKDLKEESFDFKESSTLHNIGLCYLHLGKFEKAEKYLFKASRLQEIQKDTLLLIGSYMDIATLYYEQYEDKKAIPYFLKAYNLSKRINSFELKQNTALNMAVVEENRKNFSLALQYRKEYETWRDSLTDQNKVWSIAELEKKFAVKQKQKEVNILEAQNKLKRTQRNTLLFSSILLFILFIIGIYFYRIKIKQNNVILSQKKELDLLNATKDKLFSIVSHDLRTSVNALKRSNTKLLLNLEEKNYTQLDVLLNHNSAITNGIFNLLENLLNWALLQTKQIYFHPESLHLYSIIDQVVFNYKGILESKDVKFENRVSVNVEVFADLDSLKIILRNLLDNAIKFTEPEGIITIDASSYDDKFCRFVICDSGIGMDISTQNEILKDSLLLSKKRKDNFIGTGLGLQLCKSLILKNKGRLEIESEINKGTKMIVILPKYKNHG